jgi:hypothetical protein
LVAIFLLLGLNSCHPVPTNDGRVRTVAVLDLVEMYRNRPDDARRAFDGQTVKVLVTHFDKGGPPAELRVILEYGPREEDNHPVVVFRAGKEPIPAGMKTAVWIRGTCLGRVDDGKDRHLPGYTFKVVVVDCRVVSPPTAVGP